jgi:hypothetical protein
VGMALACAGSICSAISFASQKRLDCLPLTRSRLHLHSGHAPLQIHPTLCTQTVPCPKLFMLSLLRSTCWHYEHSTWRKDEIHLSQTQIVKGCSGHFVAWSRFALFSLSVCSMLISLRCQIDIFTSVLPQLQPHQAVVLQH